MKTVACLLVVAWMAGCAHGPGGPLGVDLGRERQVGAVLDDWHLAAAHADAARYFGHFSGHAVFVGTDGAERWDLAAFRTFAMPHFERGTAWTYVATSRHVVVSRGGDVAWFDESLRNDKYGEVRGSGVLLWQGGRWRIAHYVMSFPVPNEVAGEVIGLVRGRAASSP